MHDYHRVKKLVEKANNLREGKGSFRERLLKRLAFVSIYFFIATALIEFLGFDQLAIESRGLQMAGAVLGAFMALNLNTGYGKWERAVGLLGGLKSSCIGLASVGYNTFMGKNWKKEYINTVSVIPEALKAQVSGEENIRAYMELLDEKSAQELELAKDKSLWISAKLTMLIQQAMVEEKMIDDIFSTSESYRDEMIQSSGAIIGMRLWPTPVIVRNLTEAFFMIYMFFLPWTAAVHFGWFGPFVCIGVALVLLSMDLAGKDLSHPFDKDSMGAVPFDAFCDFLKGELHFLRSKFEIDATPSFENERGVNSSSFPS